MVKITGQSDKRSFIVSDKFFKVRQHPDVWANNRKICSGVVNMTPWHHASLNYGNVNIKVRKAWNAPEPIWRNEVIYYNTVVLSLVSILNKIVIHHTNNSKSILYNEKKQQSRGYAALGYHFFIDQKGTVYEGRPLEVMGSHAGTGVSSGPLNDPDWGAIGIVLQGDFHHKDDWFSSTNATNNQLIILEKLIVQLKCKYCINQLLMHREVIRSGKPTVCPGDHLVPIIQKLRMKLKMKGR
ncbi:hypothetical protein MNBD_GAMMA09-2500 [hydrothermal vent metagenome]|uniref:N-acetylmuramoyl-L-alanine amidase domain-containing protein n=1 Tax=hydrothermal vent metagenome TaxID=652676 RepID=A0A3B0XQK1_9ZZZZ